MWYDVAMAVYTDAEKEVTTDLEYLASLHLVEKDRDGRWCKTPWAVEIGREGWVTVVAAAARSHGDN